jgi:hypothetical protein
MFCLPFRAALCKLMFGFAVPLEWMLLAIEQHYLKNVNDCLNTNIYSFLETFDGQGSNLYLNVVRFFNTSVN